MFQIPTSRNENEMETLESHTTELDLPIFNSGSPPTVTIQPQRNETNRHRRPIPVSTIDSESTRETHFIPRNGLDFLDGVDQLYIQQTVELHDLLSNEDSENRYTVKVPRGETIYLASESSNNTNRLCFGSSRAFTLRLFDQTQQEALEFRRRLACGNCSFLCYLQVLEVWLPTGELVGTIKQQMTLTTPMFFVYNRHNTLVYRVGGPQNICGCLYNGKDIHFKIYNADGTIQLGSINHLWDQVQVAYMLSVQFPGSSANSREKALLLGSAFLLEYMFFDTSGKKNCIRCAC